MLLRRTLRSLSQATHRLFQKPAAPAELTPFSLEGLEDRKLLSLTIDLRVAGGGKEAEVSSLNDTVTINVFAVVEGSDNNLANDGMAAVHGSFLSANVAGGSTKGDLFFDLVRPFTASASADSNHPTGETAFSIDLDGDGDKDVGSNNDNNVNGFVVARASFQQGNGEQVSSSAQRWKLGTLTYTVKELLSKDGLTRINFRVRDHELNSAWMEDGKAAWPSLGYALNSGSPVVVRLAAAPDNTPPTATASASSITAAKTTPHSFTVTYTDADSKIDLATIGAGDVTVNGPGGAIPATLVDTTGDGTKTITATYRVSPPGGTWDSADNGAYTIRVNAGQVADLKGNTVAAANVGSFSVNIAATNPNTAPLPTLNKNGVLTINGAAGNDNITIAPSGSQIRVTVNGKATNFTTSKVKRIFAYGHNGNDKIITSAGINNKNGFFNGGLGDDSIVGTDGNDRIDGSSNNDTLRGGGGSDIIDAGNGNDQLFGDSGNDRLDGAAGSDVLNGGSGGDTADYSKRTRAVTADIDNVADDGESNERDNIRSDVENIWGGSGNDRLTGSSGVNYLIGNSGQDTLTGLGGNDTLDGGRQADQLLGLDGNDTFFARDNTRDTVDGGSGSDRANADSNDLRRSIESSF